MHIPPSNPDERLFGNQETILEYFDRVIRETAVVREKTSALLSSSIPHLTELAQSFQNSPSIEALWALVENILRYKQEFEAIVWPRVRMDKLDTDHAATMLMHTPVSLELRPLLLAACRLVLLEKRYRTFSAIAHIESDFEQEVAQLPEPFRVLHGAVMKRFCQEQPEGFAPDSDDDE